LWIFGNFEDFLRILRIFENISGIFGFFGNITKILRNGNGLLRMPREYTGVLGFFFGIFGLFCSPYIYKPFVKTQISKLLFFFGASISPAQDLATN
jgi:hypothetical protein